MEAEHSRKHYWFKVQQYVYRTWVPQAREGAVLLNIPGTNKFYLYGGVAQEPLNGIAKLSVHGNNDCVWEIVKPNYLTQNKTIKGRYGFHGTYYQGKLFFFFGCQMYDKMRQERTCLDEVIIYDPYSSNLMVKVPQHAGSRELDPRKYFAGFFLHDTYYCHGGINTKGTMINQMIGINLDNLLWHDVAYAKGGKIPLDPRRERFPHDSEMFPDYCYGHRMAVVTC